MPVNDADVFFSTSETPPRVTQNYIKEKKKPASVAVLKNKKKVPKGGKFSYAGVFIFLL